MLIVAAVAIQFYGKRPRISLSGHIVVSINYLNGKMRAIFTVQYGPLVGFGSQV